MPEAIFTPYLQRWRLTQDGAPFRSPNSWLLPVRRDATPAMLKIATTHEEEAGHQVMTWWSGEGAAQVFEVDGPALLMERAQSAETLERFVDGRDEEATRILCNTLATLHGPRAKVPPVLIPLEQRFDSLWSAAHQQVSAFEEAAQIARTLLATPQDIRVLHGDMHHGNVLDFGPRGWLAIDPKGIVGERAFDYANLFCNPSNHQTIARSKLYQRIELVAKLAQLDRHRLLDWIIAWSALSASWCIEDGLAPDDRFAITVLALELRAAL